MSDERLHQDGLVSAYLDGEATADEIAEVEASDDLLARVEEFRSVRAAVAEPVTLLSADRRDGLIDTALQVADPGEAPADKVVPLRRPPRLLLAVAAAVIVLAAVVGADLITSTGGGDHAPTAADAPAVARAPAAAGTEEAIEAAAAQAAMPEMDMEADYDTMSDEPRPDAEPMAGTEMAADAAMAEAFVADEELLELPATAQAATDAGAAVDKAPAATTTGAAVATDDGPSEQVADLGVSESLGSLFEDIGADRSGAFDDRAMVDAGACAAAVQDHALDLSSETIRDFVATVGREDPITLDARFVRRRDGTAAVVYAVGPDCEITIHELPDS